MGKKMSKKEHAEIMLWNSRVLRAKLLGFRELILTMIGGGIVPPLIEKRFRDLDQLTGRDMKKTRTDLAAEELYARSISDGRRDGQDQDHQAGVLDG